MGRQTQGSDKVRRRSWGRGLRVGGLVTLLALLVAVPVALALAPASSTDYDFATTATTGWKNTHQTVPIDVTTSEATATATVHFSIDGGDTWSTVIASQAGTATVDVLVTAEGSHLFRYFASDNGTTSVEATHTGDHYVNIDMTDPVTTVVPVLASSSGSSPWFDSAVEVSLTATDTLSGVPALGTFYRLNDDVNPTVYVHPFTVSAEGSTKLIYGSVDRASNEETRTAWVNIDTSIPTVSYTTAPSRSSGWYNKNVIVTLTGVDAVSGIDKTQYRLNGATAWTDAPDNKFTVLASANAKLTYDYRAVDKAGNASAVSSLKLNMDSKKPRTYGQKVSGSVGKPIKVKYRITDNLSPKAKSVSVKIKNSKGHVVKVQRFRANKNVNKWYSFKWTPKAKGTYRYYVYAKDLAGNSQNRAGWAKIKVK